MHSFEEYFLWISNTLSLQEERTGAGACPKKDNEVAAGFREQALWGVVEGTEFM